VSDIDFDQAVKELLKLDQRLLDQLGAVLSLLPAGETTINKH
jgi:hypothetical protein